MRYYNLAAAILFSSGWLSARQYDARLIGPEQVPISQGCVFWELPYEIEFIWPSDEPLELDLFVKDGVIKTGPSVYFTIKNRAGTEVRVMEFMSMPPFPEGQIKVNKGEKLRIGLYAWNGIAEINYGEVYTISATLRAQTKSDPNVRIVTEERKVVFTHTSAKDAKGRGL